MDIKLDKLKKFLSNVPVFFYEVIDSTNLRAVEILQETNDDNFLVVAREQTAGKGRIGKSFFSPKDTGVYFSVVIHSDCGVSDIVGLTPMVAVAVVRGIEKLTGLSPKIKWVNDIYLSEKKICGILVQKFDNAYIIGIGINITTQSFPENLSDTAGSLNVDIDKNELIAYITNEIFSMSSELSKRTFMKEYKEKSLVLNKEINYFINGEQFDATAIDIDPNGGLIIKKNGIKKILTSGEITVRTK